MIIEDEDDHEWVDEPKRKETIEDPAELEEATSGETYREYDHPVEDAVQFHWYDGGDWRVDAGPMACIDTSEAGGVTEVTMHADEYADYVYDEANSDLWDEYSSESNFEAQIDKHYLGQYAFVVNPDKTICNSVWENAVGTNNEAPDDIDRED